MDSNGVHPYSYERGLRRIIRQDRTQNTERDAAPSSQVAIYLQKLLIIAEYSCNFSSIGTQSYAWDGAKTGQHGVPERTFRRNLHSSCMGRVVSCPSSRWVRASSARSRGVRVPSTCEDGTATVFKTGVLSF